MIKLKNILLEQLNEFPTPLPGKYDLRFEKRYKDGEREPERYDNIEVTAEDIKEFEKNKRLYPSYDITNQDFWNGIASEISSHPQNKIARIRVTMTSVTKPEFEIYIDSVDIGNVTITPPNKTTTYEDLKDDIKDQLEEEGENFVKATIECRCRVDNKDYKFQFETDDPDTTADHIYWNSDSFQQETGLDEFDDIVAKLTA
jgi:hypothetical protein